MNKKFPLIGGHVSTAGGLFRGIENGTAIGADCIQIFGASPKSYFTKLPTEDEVKRFRDAQEQKGIKEVYLHAAYLVNIASPDPKLRGLSVKNLSEHLKIAELLGAVGLIFHIGSGKELPKEEAMGFVIEGMRKVVENVPGKSLLIMENSASSKKLGAFAEEIGMLHRGAGLERIKVCIDTAHAFEAGIIESFTTENVKAWCDTLVKEIGLDEIIALHVNDSKTPCNSQHDRHENIGEGRIGIDGFRALACEKRLHDKAWILEVPGTDKQGPDKDNIDRLRSCF